MPARVGVLAYRPDDRRLLAAAVRQAGGEAVLLESAGEAVEPARRGEIQLILATERLAGLGGFGLAREVPPGFPVGLVLERPVDGWLARASGASFWVSRPLDVVALARAVSSLLKEERVA
jgi:DNA-binding response OmpR family regulator